MRQSRLRTKAFLLGIFLLIGTVMIFDEDIQKSVQSYRSGTTDSLSKILKPFGDGKVSVPVFFGLSLVGGTLRYPSIMDLGLTGLGAMAVNGTFTGTLQAVLGRERPPKEKGSYSYNPFSEGGSLPSGHTSMAFTIAAVLSSQYNSYGVVPVLSYSLASLVGLSRINDNKHFASDVLAGAILGIASTRLTLRVKKRFRERILRVWSSLSVVCSKVIYRLKERA